MNVMIEEKNAIDKHVGNRIKQQRIFSSISQTAVAEYLDVSFQQVQKYEKGANRISAGNLYKIAKFLKVEVSFFYEGLPGTQIPAENEDPLDRIDIELASKIHAIKNDDLKKKIFQLVKSVGDVAS